jgi:hypothetical protein
MNNFIVGQVTPTMLTHIGFGTFIFFGVSSTFIYSFQRLIFTTGFLLPRRLFHHVLRSRD